MDHWLYKLTFTSGIHVGEHDNLHNDILFAALCTEAVKMDCLDLFYEAVNQGDIAFSDALPYQGEDYFLPRPLLPDMVVPRSCNGTEALPLSGMEKYCLHGFSKEYQEQTKFGIQTTDFRMNYILSYFRFLPNNGLYVIVKSSNQEFLNLWEALLIAVGLTGIGGKKSSGLGKFGVVKCKCPSILEYMLTDDTADRQMCLGVVYPKKAELKKILKNSSTTLIRRSGFDTTVSYLFAPGSCFQKRFDGIIIDSTLTKKHPTWRLAKSIFIGLPT
jgi:CRISPR-associated protein Csm4